MPRKCSICEHARVEEINRELLNGTPYRNIAERFNVSTTSLHRHKEHIPAAMARAREAEEVNRADSLLEQVKNLQEKARDLLKQAEEAGELKVALQGVREAKGCLELLAKMQGELQQEGTININVQQQLITDIVIILQDEIKDPAVLERIGNRLASLDRGR